MNALLGEVYSSLDMAVFTREPGGTFRLQSGMPDWLLFFFGSAHKTSYPVMETFPYLECFKEEAEQHWHTRQSTPLASGSWLELDALEKELPLEASALWLDGQSVLLLQNLGARYWREQQQLQQLREGLLDKEMLEMEVRKRTLQIRRREEEIAIKLVSLTSFRDEETGTHVRRIGLYAAAIAKAIGWSEESIDAIRIAAPMHDIGKIGIPDRILRKPSVLSDEEFTIMKGHTLIGATMLQGTQIQMLDMAADIAHYHHERWDGSGYPLGLAGEAIPLAARITTVVDIYDALVHERVYKKAMPESEALALMNEMKGQHLDPSLLEVFENMLPVMRAIRTEIREDNETLTQE